MDTSRFIWTDSEINDFKNKIEYFKSFRDKPINQETFFEAYKTCYLLFDKIPVISTRVDVPYLLRGRPNYNEEIFEEEWQISYNTRNTEKINLGRFNRPGSPMFYSSAFSELDPQFFGLVASMESCKELFIEENKVPYQYITLGKWFLKEHFDVVSLCYDEKFLKANPRFDENTRKHVAHIQNIFPPKSAEFILDFWKILSRLAANKYEIENDHFLTTAYLCAFINYRKHVMNADVYGVMYPSTMTENNGLNIVLTPTAVNKYLTLQSTFMIKFTRDPKVFKKFDIEQCTEEAKVHNHNFTFVKRDNF